MRQPGFRIKAAVPECPLSGSDHMFVAERQALRPAGLQQLYWMGDAL
jgi:hypothetical protein